ncbi:Kinesin-like protein KIF19 [Geodia barretti]|uniref:Kinesin-like protein n=1 Tax=Geodia barretti TaxID=519541 RepID=A0AA35QWH7_GEOBA|nr:Kinesin-like protein KIF19 [Geodia barretti]
MKEQNITVALRVRPINPREVRSGARPIARVVDKNLVVLMDPNRDSDDILRAKRSHDHSYMFDVAFSQRATQRDVYQRTSQGLVSKVIRGYNATVFAYGPTGAGKTYTMLGKTGEPGIMALTLSDLFAKMEQNQATSRYRVTMAYLEIYNEMVRNLLGPSVGILDLREDAHGATVVSGLTEVEVHDSDEVMDLLTRGNLRRTCEPTAVNKTSSRSHAVLKVTVEQQSRVLNMCQKIRTGVLFMIDLAGSERAANTGTGDYE